MGKRSMKDGRVSGIQEFTIVADRRLIREFTAKLQEGIAIPGHYDESSIQKLGAAFDEGRQRVFIVVHHRESSSGPQYTVDTFNGPKSVFGMVNSAVRINVV